MFLDRAVKWLLPREEQFFDLLEQGAARTVESGATIVELVAASSPLAREQVALRMRDVEHASDKVIHQVYDQLNRTFVTPFDRSDIYSLATALEDIVDLNNATSSLAQVHAMDDLPEGSVELARFVCEATKEIETAVQKLRGLKRLGEVKEHCRKLNALEHDGDEVFRSRMAAMYRAEKDAIRLLKHKEFLEGLERTLDACDHVGTALETIVIKNA
jgi:uncharacterized protein